MAAEGPSTSRSIGGISLSPPSSAGSVQGQSSSAGRLRRSLVWQYFDYDPIQEKSVCQVLSQSSGNDSDNDVCGAAIAGKFPTNLKIHLKKKHPIQHAELLSSEEEEKEKKECVRRAKSLKVSHQLTLADSLQCKSVYSKESVRYREICKKLAIFIGSTNVPNSIVENLEFKDLLFTMDSRFVVPGRSVVGKELDKVLIELKAKIGSYLLEANKVSICVDMWSKKGMTSSYLGITAHFYSHKDRRLHTATLAVRRMPSPHTGDNIRDLVDQVLDEWQIPLSKVSATLTDNGSNMLAAFRTLLSEDDRVDSESDVEDSDSDAAPHDVDVIDFEEQEVDHELAFQSLKRVSCFAHTLQLVVQKFDEVTEFKALIKRAHQVVRKVNSSTKATEKLIASCGKKLIRDCPTRWSSTYLMFDRLLSVKSALTTVLLELEWDNLATSEWKTLEALRDLLHPFAQLTSLVSGEEFTTISSVIPAIMELNLHLEEVC